MFPISGFLDEPLVNENFHNSITNHNIDTKLGPVIKIGKRNTKISKKKINNDIISINVTSLLFFFIFGQFKVIGFRMDGL